MRPAAGDVADEVRLLVAGGTIAMSGSPAVPSTDVIDQLQREAHQHVRSEVVQLTPSVHFTRADALALCRRAVDLARDGLPVVITHGTDLMEEVAFLCDLLHDAAAPIVFTGAMRTASAPGADGLANLHAAVAVAGSPTARGLGVLTVFAGEIHAARFVRKADSTSIDAFASPQTGPLGYIEEGRLTVFWRPQRRPALAVERLDARVEIVTVALDTRPELIEAVAGVCDGVVVSLPGAGHAPPAVMAAILTLAERLPVAAVARPWRGALLHETYGFDGAEGDLRSGSVACAGSLGAPAARIALMACLGAGLDREHTAEVLAQYD